MEIIWVSSCRICRLQGGLYAGFPFLSFPILPALYLAMSWSPMLCLIRMPFFIYSHHNSCWGPCTMLIYRPICITNPHYLLINSDGWIGCSSVTWNINVSASGEQNWRTNCCSITRQETEKKEIICKKQGANQRMTVFYLTVALNYQKWSKS